MAWVSLAQAVVDSALQSRDRRSWVDGWIEGLARDTGAVIVWLMYDLYVCFERLHRSHRRTLDASRNRRAVRQQQQYRLSSREQS